MDSTNIGLAGEFYVLAQLAQRGFVASFTLANTKAVDILVFNETLDHLFKLEVKTTQRPPRNAKLFSDDLVYSGPIPKKWRRTAGLDSIACERFAPPHRRGDHGDPQPVQDRPSRPPAGRTHGRAEPS